MNYWNKIYTFFFQVNSLISRKFAPVGFSPPAATNDAIVHATMEKKRSFHIMKYKQKKIKGTKAGFHSCV